MAQCLDWEDLDLERRCSCWAVWDDSKPKSDCRDCKGKGWYSTDFGDQIILMLRHQGLVAPAPPEEDE